MDFLNFVQKLLYMVLGLRWYALCKKVLEDLDCVYYEYT